MGSADISQFVVTTADGTACEISTLKVRALFPHLPATFTGTSSNFWASSLLADLPVFPSLVCGSCSSGQGFAYSFLQIPPHDGHPCCLAIHFPLPGYVRDFHPLERAHGAQTKKSHIFFRYDSHNCYYCSDYSTRRTATIGLYAAFPLILIPSFALLACTICPPPM